MSPEEEERQISQVKARLLEKYPSTPRTVVATAVEDALARFDGGRVRDFVPLLVERRASATLARSALHR
ncbi:MAG: DUF3562 domain-containing protein [Rhodococcus sp. (in: high G+C Gram-positive bacteria)]|uniref:three-helix bundle dimerization domain-containing protein n=1 Tax=Rhodococcus sp. TaxID=1831 RepID=UPI003BAFE411